MKMLKEESGKTSAKRVSGFIILLVCIVIFGYKEWHNTDITNKDIFNNLMILSTILLGLDIAKYLTGIVNLKKQPNTQVQEKTDSPNTSHEEHSTCIYPKCKS
jgi:hypothetical protein